MRLKCLCVYVVDCFSEILVTENGFLTSPNYPNPYPPFLECLWVLRVDVGATIRLTMFDFDLEESEDCQSDVFMVSRLPSVYTMPQLYILGDA